MTKRWQLNRREMIATSVAATCGSLAMTKSSAATVRDASDDRPVIWDAHGHFAGLRGSPEERVDHILQHADRMGIEKLMLCMGLQFNTDPTPEEMIADNDAILLAVKHAPDRILGFVYLNPKHVIACLKELERCVKDGPMVGVKLWLTVRCNHPDLDAIVRLTEQLGVPILQHVYQRTLDKNKPGESFPADLSELAARHPDANFIAAHTGNDWEQGIRSIRANENVYAEVCGSDATAGMVEMAVRELGANRVIYGSDIDGRSFASQIGKVTGADIADEDKSLILAGNLQRILKPVLSKHGRRETKQQ